MECGARVHSKPEGEDELLTTADAAKLLNVRGRTGRSLCARLNSPELRSLAKFPTISATAVRNLERAGVLRSVAMKLVGVRPPFGTP